MVLNSIITNKDTTTEEISTVKSVQIYLMTKVNIRKYTFDY